MGSQCQNCSNLVKKHTKSFSEAPPRKTQDARRSAEQESNPQKPAWLILTQRLGTSRESSLEGEVLPSTKDWGPKPHRKELRTGPEVGAGAGLSSA